MNVLMVRTKIKEENVADARAAVERVIQALEQTQPAGVRYASCLLSDGVTFVALVELEDDGSHPLRELPAYAEMVENLKQWYDGPSYTSLTYTSLMAMTTIRVETELRDRLAAQAAANGRSLGAELRAMMDETMWQGIEAGYRRLATSREEMAVYQAEAAAWTSADPGGLASTAADEYPEYNS